MPGGILNSISLPIGSSSRRVPPWAASFSVIVAVAVTSWPRIAEPMSSASKFAPAVRACARRTCSTGCPRSCRRRAAPAAARRGAAESVRPPGEALEIALAPAERTCARPAAEAFEALEARLALGVDLAAVERLALVVVADDLVGAVELGELVGRLRVLLVGVRVQLLGELAIGLLDVFRARRLGHPQHLIGVAHPCYSEMIPRAGPSARLSSHQCGGSVAVVQRGEAYIPESPAEGRLSYDRFSGRSLRTVHWPWWARQASPCSQDSAPSRM